MHELQEVFSNLASRKVQSVLIDGPSGCGKTYWASYYATQLNVPFYTIQPNVQSLRDIISTSYELSEPILVCIENIDSGVSSASQTILKFLEEPISTIYLVVTCRNLSKIPDTILSRSAHVSVPNPTSEELKQYCETTYADKLSSAPFRTALQYCRSYKDVDTLASYSTDNINYLFTLYPTLMSKDSISNIVWKLGHLDNNAELDSKFSTYILLKSSKDPRIQKYCLQCLKDLENSRIASHAVLSKLVLECKYGD